mgnify:CR=1 FL=1
MKKVLTGNERVIIYGNPVDTNISLKELSDFSGSGTEGGNSRGG